MRVQTDDEINGPDGIVDGGDATDATNPCDYNQSQITLSVTTTEACEIVVFSLVTPNGDGENDYFQIVGIDSHPDNTVQIFNRWGVLVYETTAYDSKGNVFKGISEGRVTMKKNEQLPVGTYYYVLKYKHSNTGETISKSSYLYINR